LQNLSLNQLKSFVEVADPLFLPKTRNWYVKRIQKLFLEKGESVLEALVKHGLKFNFIPVESSISIYDLEKVTRKGVGCLLWGN